MIEVAASRRDRPLLALGLGRWRDARSGHGLEESFDVRGAPREGVPPEIVPRVLDELDERDE